ncbi:serine protease [Streptomyces sp. NPDC056529]|uniref:serine protease n=1 Tax=Streptomyces sp. NPDC056529 TaxID=3345855 RepID=UPI00368A5867
MNDSPALGRTTTPARTTTSGRTTSTRTTSPTRTATSRRAALRALALAGVLSGMTLSAPPATAVAAARAPETYALTIRHLDREGAATDAYRTHVTGISGPGASEEVTPHDDSGTVTVRLPRGRYLLDSTVAGREEGSGTDWIVQPRLDLDRDTTVTVDARTTAPVDVRPRGAKARFLSSLGFVEVTHGGTTRSANILAAPGLRIAHLGPDAEPGSVKEWFDTYWAGETTDYALGYTFTSSRALTGLVRHPAPSSLATVKVRRAAPKGETGTAFVSVQPGAGPTVGISQPLRPRGTATVLVTPERGRWNVEYEGPATSGTKPNRYAVNGFAVRAGATTTHTFDNPVFGPALDTAPGARPAGVRDGATLSLDVPLLADGEGHAPSAPRFRAATTTLHRDGVLIGTRRGEPGRGTFTTTPGAASYRLTATATRGDATSPGGRVTAAWTFTSAATARPAALPLSTVRFAPALGLDGTAPADARVRVPVTVQGTAAGSGVRSLTVSVSTDDGTTWTRVPVTDGRAAFRNPAAGRSVSLRAELTDTKGNTLTQTLTDAYRTR